MAVSQYGGQYNPVQNPLVGSAPASIPTANAKPLFAKWVDEYEKKQFPLQSMFKKRRESWDQVKIQVGQSYNPFITTTIGTTTANNSATIVFAANGTALMREGDVLEIIPYYVAGDATSGLNYYKAETTVVNSITNSTTIEAYRDSDRTSTGSWPVHAAGSYVRVISRARAYNQPFELSPVYRGDSLYTHPQRIDGKIAGDIAGINTPDFESSNHFERMVKSETTNMKWYLEEALGQGWRMTGDVVTGDGNAKPHQMGGVYWWLNQLSANVTDLANTQLDIYDVVDLLRTVWKTHRKGPALTVLAGPDTIEIFDQLINPYREATMSDTDVTLMTKVISTRWGRITIVPTMHFREGNVAFIDPSDWSWGPYKGADWNIVRREPEHTNRPTREWAMWGDFALICEDLQRQSLITGIDTRLANYSGRVFLT